MYTHITVSPESLYGSLTKVNFKTFYFGNPPAKTRIVFPANYHIADVKVRIRGSKTSYEMKTTKEGTILTFKPSSQEREVSAIIIVDGAVEDSGEIYYPLISAELHLGFRVESCDDLMIRIIYPYPCHAYANSTAISVDDRTYRAGDIGRKESSYHLKYHDKGYIHTQVSYACHDSLPKSSSTNVRINSYYRPSFVHYLPPFLFPAIIGLPIIALWGIPDLSFMQRLLATVSYVPVVFTIWQKSISIGKQRISSLINNLYIFWGVVCFLYIATFQLFQVEAAWTIFIPYLLSIPYLSLLIYTISVLTSFGINPIQVSEPKIFRVHRFFAQIRHDLEGWMISRALRKRKK